MPSPLTTRSAGVIASRLLKATIGLSFQRMFFTGRVTLPLLDQEQPVAREPGDQDRLRIEQPDVPEARDQHAALARRR